MRKINFLLSAVALTLFALIVLADTSQPALAGYQGLSTATFTPAPLVVGSQVQLKQDYATTVYGTEVTFTATIILSNKQTKVNGTVVFADSLVQLGSVPVSGGDTAVVSFKTNSLSVGSHTIWAIFQPSASCGGWCSVSGSQGFVSHSVMFKPIALSNHDTKLNSSDSFANGILNFLADFVQRWF
jgi:hypothetical protein